MPAHAVLGDDRRALSGDQCVNAVVDLRIHMIGPPGQYQDPFPFGPRPAYDLRPALAQREHVLLVLGIGRIRRALDLLPCDVREVPAEDLRHVAHKIHRAVDADVVGNEGLAREFRAVGRNDLGVIGYDGAVEVIVAQMLVDVVGETGIKDRVERHLAEGLDVAVDELGREAGRIARDRGLSAQIETARGGGAVVDCKAQACEEAIPEGPELIEVQHHRDADAPALALLRPILPE